MSRILLSFAIIVVYSLPFQQAAAKEEVKNYDIKLAGIKIGELKATRTVKDTITYYTLDSRVSFWFFVTVQVHHHTDVVYHGNKLMSSISTSTTSKGNFSAEIVWQNDHYEVKVEAYKHKEYDPINEMLHYNVARFYFDEPIGMKKTLADAYGVTATIGQVKKSIYEVDIVGNRNKFFYEKGVLVRASMYSKVKNYEVVLRK
jgi:hypothetical protein